MFYCFYIFPQYLFIIKIENTHKNRFFSKYLFAFFEFHMHL